MRHALLVLLCLFACGCRVGGCAANALGDVVGETGDAHCDRRIVTEGHEASAFCQEIIDTVAQSQFEDDCRDSHGAKADDGTCPREQVIAGCKIEKSNDDGSEVFDWYYLPDEAAAPLPPGVQPTLTKDDVRALCADRERYEDGASYVDP